MRVIRNRISVGELILEAKVLNSMFIQHHNSFILYKVLLRLCFKIVFRKPVNKRISIFAGSDLRVEEKIKYRSRR
jgi:hypothetical protein